MAGLENHSTKEVKISCRFDPPHERRVSFQNEFANNDTAVVSGLVNEQADSTEGKQKTIACSCCPLHGLCSNYSQAFYMIFWALFGMLIGMYVEFAKHHGK